MHVAPLVDQIMGTLRESPSQQTRRLDVKQRLMLAEAGVEMSRTVITGIHRDHDAEKAAELRHCRLVSDGLKSNADWEAPESMSTANVACGVCEG